MLVHFCDFFKKIAASDAAEHQPKLVRGLGFEYLAIAGEGTGATPLPAWPQRGGYWCKQV